MNIVLDDAVEVKQITKTNPTESRRSLGASRFCPCVVERD
jgi:small nuclear ribonucleoprotein (snRNP)-like protein